MLRRIPLSVFNNLSVLQTMQDKFGFNFEFNKIWLDSTKNAITVRFKWSGGFIVGIIKPDFTIRPTMELADILDNVSDPELRMNDTGRAFEAYLLSQLNMQFREEEDE